MENIVEISGSTSFSGWLASHPESTTDDYYKAMQERREAIAASIGVSLPELHAMGPVAVEQALSRTEENVA